MTRNPPPTGLPRIRPQVRLLGGVDESMLRDLLGKLENLQADEPLVVELTTMGGEAETARRIAQELRSVSADCEVYVFGKTYVYSAGITILSAVPCHRRFLTADTVLLIHERRFERTVEFQGALRSAVAIAQDLISELETAEKLEREGFADFARGSRLSGDELYEKVLRKDWYQRADEAVSLGLVAGIA